MAEAYPLAWPEGWKRTQYRGSSKFKIAHFAKARDFLIDEVRRMGGTSFVLSTNYRLRNDGFPLANQANPTDPGVAIYFKYQKREMCFACDEYSTVKENAYAIAKTIEALRGIERWGASDMMERAFRGFMALPARASQPWRDVLGVGPGPASVEAIECAFRAMSRQHHPDIGGDREKFEQIVRARDDAKRELRG